jgi:two-component system alkaline phosphatase synthesis response regulator PhoP
LKFFIVDDDQQTIDLMTVLLEAKGHSVSSSIAGAYALPQISAKKPDCVLTDLVMAELNGIELCRELKAQPELRSVKIVMVSARPRDLWLERAREAGADGYIMKPLPTKTFVQEVEKILSGG